MTFDVSVTNTSPSESATVTAITDTVNGVPLDVTVVGGPITATTCATGAVVAPGASYTCSFTLLVSGGNAGDVVVDQIGLTLTDDERQTLQAWARRPKTAQRLALRSRIVLACGEGRDNGAVAAGLGVNRATVGKWRRRSGASSQSVPPRRS